MAGQDSAVAVDYGEGRTRWQMNFGGELVQPGQVQGGEDNSLCHTLGVQDRISEIDGSFFGDTSHLIFAYGKGAALKGVLKIGPIGEVD